jgi:DNA polymerase III alpha subunit (gram-positive type)
MNDKQEKAIKALLTQVIDGRIEEQKRNEEVLETVKAQFGEPFRIAAKASIDMNSNAMEVLKVAAHFLPGPLADTAAQIVASIVKDGEHALYALAATLQYPELTEEQRADKCVEVKKLAMTLFDAAAAVRAKEEKATRAVAKEVLGDKEDE